MPTVPIVILTDTPIAAHSTELRKEIKSRVQSGSVTGFAASKLSWVLAKELRHDSVGWNANEAMRMLWGLCPECQEALENELEQGDSQSRPIAAGILRRYMKIPSDGLLIACVKDLRDDLNELGSRHLRSGNSKYAAGYLARWSTRAPPFVREVIQSDDEQQRFMASLIVGFGGSVQDMEVAVPTLLPHIYDNNLWGDAKIAAPALYNFGPAVIPLLLQELPVADKQAHAIILHIIERLEHPERAFNTCTHPMPTITVIFEDPLTCSLESLIRFYSFENWGIIGK